VRDGGGATAAPGLAGVGLVGMRERVEALGGRLSAGPAGTGWEVRAQVPRVPAVSEVPGVAG
jgi:signal transduction histidine kinase